MSLKNPHMQQFLWAIVMGGLLMLGGGLAAYAQESHVIQVEINKGTMIKLDRPVASIVMADPLTADVQVVSSQLIFVHGKKIGETSIYAVDAKDETVFSGTVEVTHNLSKLESVVRQVAPNADVGFRTVDGGLVMDGFTTSTSESEQISNVASAFISGEQKMVNMLTTAGSDQVTLHVKVVEMSRDTVKRFGINMQHVLTPGGMALQLLHGADIEIDGNGLLNGSLIEAGQSGLLDRGGSTSSQVLGRFGGGRINGVIDALETQGLVNVLAEPNLTTTSGKAASFLAGGEFPIPMKGSDGSISVQYKPFGVSLNFTPVVMSKERISVAVAPEVSTISFDNPIEVDGIRNPILLTRKANATVELGSGQTFMLAGLLRNDNSNSVDKFPGLGDVPILGALFRSTQFQTNQTELVILVTPYIVRPVSEKRMQTPVDGYQPPNDLQRLLIGNLYQQEPMDDEEETDAEEAGGDIPEEEEPGGAPALQGDGGFILE